MILYTTQPQELIFPTDDKEFEKQQTIPFGDGHLVVEPDSESLDQYRVVRVISSNPNAYMDESLAPGATLSVRVDLEGNL
ncbi:YlzJ-like family protein [Texcoconibacillus texcoconensis]|uniref:Uncharacterized protein n=1 Tax=Texcoconibacillus texcoconensis TaxID=1095777 RepID=A0A840QKP5_9BACI|nr:YlzJ-like family protein [Texcoconibacillus texcoconensis]MBB5172017.1 hypothetical protein [Texcoconibacillus texcoconensis]